MAVEVAVHDHCGCDGDRGADTTAFGGSSSEHGHCTDTSVGADYVVAGRKDLSFMGAGCWVALPVWGLIASLSPSYIESSTTQSDDRGAFYAPLRTVILLS